MAKKAEPEILDEGIKIDLGGGYFVLFSKSWGSLDTQRFSKTTNDLLALKLLIRKVENWKIPNSDWEDIPFDKEGLLKQIDDFIADPEKECFSIPTPLQIELVRGFYAAASASYKLDFLALVESRQKPAS